MQCSIVDIDEKGKGSNLLKEKEKRKEKRREDSDVI